MADTQATVLAAAQSGDATSLHRKREVADVLGTFTSTAERERFFHAVRAALNTALGVGARAMNVDFKEPY